MPLPHELPLIQSTDLIFERSFPVNSIGWSSEPTDLTDGGQPLALGPDATSLYIGCHKPNWFAHVTIPAEGGTAQFIHEGIEIPYNVSSVDSSVLGGMLYHEGRLLSTKFIFYDAGFTAVSSHQSSSDGGTTWTTPSRLGDKNPGYYAGYMCDVPTEWRTLLGGPALTGQGILSIIGRTSFGPAAFAFDPADIDGSETIVPVVDLLYYTFDNPLHSPDVPNELFTRADQLGGCFIVPGTRSLLFVGFHGTGAICYGQGSPDNPPPPGMCYNPLDGAQGEHTYPYRGQVWAYDLNDLVRVKNGEINPWDVQPYAVWALPGVSQDAYRVKRGGVAFDPSSGRIYVTEIYYSSPRVDVFRVAVPISHDCVTSPLVVTDVWAGTHKSLHNSEKIHKLQWTGPSDLTVLYDSKIGRCEFTDARGCKVVVP